MTLASDLTCSLGALGERTRWKVAEFLDLWQARDARPGHVRLAPFFYNLQDDHVSALERLATPRRH